MSMRGAIPAGKLRGVQFGTLSADDVAAMSTVHVTTTSINKSGVVVFGGVSDPRMGTTNRSMLCSTCGNTMAECPGHSGHVVLQQPVINVEFISWLYKVLYCTCRFCSRLLLRPSHPKYRSVLSVSDPKDRLNELFQVCRGISVCGEHVAGEGSLAPRAYVERGYCGGPQPDYAKVDCFIVCSDAMSPNDMYDMLQHIPPEDAKVMGFTEHSAPCSLMWKNLIVPPVTIRPSKCRMNTARLNGEDQLTLHLRSIVKQNQSAYLGGYVDMSTLCIRGNGPSVVRRGRSLQHAMRAARTQASDARRDSTVDADDEVPDDDDVDAEDDVDSCDSDADGDGGEGDGDEGDGDGDGDGDADVDGQCDGDADGPCDADADADGGGCGGGGDDVSAGCGGAGHVVASDVKSQAAYIALQRCVAGYQNTKYQVHDNNYRSQTSCVRDRFSGVTKAKKGRVRLTVMGKRMDFAARSVITPDDFIRPDEIGVPCWISRVLTYPEVVHRFNIHQLYGDVRTGRVSSITKKGTDVSISTRDMDLSQLRLAYGDVVRRHMRDGDWVVFNRQPSLHRYVVACLRRVS